MPKGPVDEGPVEQVPDATDVAAGPSDANTYGKARQTDITDMTSIHT